MLPETSSQEPKVKEGSSQKKPAKKRSTKSKERGQTTVSLSGSELENWPHSSDKIYDKDGGVH